MVLLLLADVWMAYAGYVYGWKFIRNYRNYLLGIEWIIIAVSGTNVILLGLTGNNHASPSYHLMLFFDAFSRSFGITLILVLGLMKVTHRYKPSIATEIAVFALATVAGLYLATYAQPINVPWAVFYVVMTALTSLFLAYFAWRLWNIDERGHAIWVLIATAAGIIVAGMYDFYHIPGDDADHTIFYIIALTTWALMLTVYFYAYRAMHNRNGPDMGRRPKHVPRRRRPPRRRSSHDKQILDVLRVDIHRMGR
jgi:hypothetical protein